jgi:hypothetical protein
VSFDQSYALQFLCTNFYVPNVPSFYSCSFSFFCFCHLTYLPFLCFFPIPVCFNSFVADRPWSVIYHACFPVLSPLTLRRFLFTAKPELTTDVTEAGRPAPGAVYYPRASCFPFLLSHRSTPSPCPYRSLLVLRVFLYINARAQQHRRLRPTRELLRVFVAPGSWASGVARSIARARTDDELLQPAAGARDRYGDPPRAPASGNLFSPATSALITAQVLN